MVLLPYDNIVRGMLVRVSKGCRAEIAYIDGIFLRCWIDAP
jgi:hypothetical protein